MQRTGCLSFILAIVMATVCLTAVACGSTAYKTDVDVTSLTPAVDALLERPEDFATMTDEYITTMMEIDISKFSGHVVKLRASGANIDEYGIFKAPSAADVADIKATVEAYLARRVEIWMPEYMPEEFPKMEAASVKTFGQYVAYAILSEDTKTDVFAAIEAELIEK